jgi:hypothetical protein
MINCRNCINWVDESLVQIELDNRDEPHIFMGCRIFGYVENNTALESCAHYVASENLFALCGTCHLTVPKVCISLGECVNCTDTDLFCVDHCIGGDSRKFCSHFVRLHTEGAHLIYENETFDLFPTLGMPGQKPSASSPAADPIPDLMKVEPLIPKAAPSTAKRRRKIQGDE